MPDDIRNVAKDCVKVAHGNEAVRSASSARFAILDARNNTSDRGVSGQQKTK